MSKRTFNFTPNIVFYKQEKIIRGTRGSYLDLLTSHGLKLGVNKCYSEEVVNILYDEIQKYQVALEAYEKDNKVLNAAISDNKDIIKSLHKQLEEVFEKINKTPDNNNQSANDPSGVFKNNINVDIEQDPLNNKLPENEEQLKEFCKNNPFSGYPAIISLDSMAEHTESEKAKIEHRVMLDQVYSEFVKANEDVLRKEIPMINNYVKDFPKYDQSYKHRVREMFLNLCVGPKINFNTEDKKADSSPADNKGVTVNNEELLYFVATPVKQRPPTLKVYGIADAIQANGGVITSELGKFLDDFLSKLASNK